MAEHKQWLGLFARSWSEWVTVETAINMYIDWICLQEPTPFYVLTALGSASQGHGGDVLSVVAP
jgi:hypothetical protein